MAKSPSKISIVTAALMILGFTAGIAWGMTPGQELDCYCKFAQGEHPLVNCYAACTKNCGDGAAGCQDYCDKRTKCTPGKDKDDGEVGGEVGVK